MRLFKLWSTKKRCLHICLFPPFVLFLPASICFCRESGRLGPLGTLWSFCGSLKDRMFVAFALFTLREPSIRFSLQHIGGPGFAGLFEQIGARTPPRHRSPLPGDGPQVTGQTVTLTAVTWSDLYGWLRSLGKPLNIWHVDIYPSWCFSHCCLEFCCFHKSPCKTHSKWQWYSAYRWEGMKQIRRVACREKLTATVIVQ